MTQELNRMLNQALDESAVAGAVACVDARAGFMLGIAARDDDLREALTDVAIAASELCVVPRLDVPFEEEVEADAQLAVSRNRTHACVRLTHQRDLVLVCIGDGPVNVALLLAWAKEVASRVDGDEN